MKPDAEQEPARARDVLPSWTVDGARKAFDALYAAEAVLRECARQVGDGTHPEPGKADMLQDNLRRAARAFVDAEDAIMLWKVRGPA